MDYFYAVGATQRLYREVTSWTLTIKKNNAQNPTVAYSSARKINGTELIICAGPTHSLEKAIIALSPIYESRFCAQLIISSLSWSICPFLFVERLDYKIQLVYLFCILHKSINMLNSVKVVALPQFSIILAYIYSEILV